MADDVARRLLDEARRQRPRRVELLRRLVEAESPSTDAGAQAEVQGLLAAALDELGFRVRRLSGERSGGHLLAVPRRRTRGRAAQMLLGHCDTVWPLGTLERMAWSEDGGVARGPGVYDMKAGLVQGLAALDVLRRLDLEPTLTPVVFVNSDEEIGSRESRRHIVRLARAVERVFVLEPSLGPEGLLKTARKGIGRFTVRARGRAAHAGLDPEAGASAILELSYAIQELFALNDPERGVTVNVGTIDGGIRPNVIAAESRAVADVRVLTAEDAARVEAAIHGLRPRTEGVSLEVEGDIGRPPMERTDANRELWARARGAARDLGIELGEGTAGGASDGNFTSRWAATLDGLGAVGAGAHAEHEQVVVEKMAERTALLALLLLEPPLGADNDRTAEDPP